MPAEDIDFLDGETTEAIVVGNTIQTEVAHVITGLEWNDGAGTVPTDNHQKIQDGLDNYGSIYIPRPPKTQWLDGGVGDYPTQFEQLIIDQPIEVSTGNQIATSSAQLAITQKANANLPGLIVSRNWLNNTGGPSASARGVIFKHVGLDGNYRVRNGGSGGTVQQAHATHGHGFVGSFYQSEWSGCIVGQTQRHAFYVDTTSSNGTSLGECLENHFHYCVAIRAGLNSYRMEDTNGVSGGVTDGFITNSVAAHGNCSADVSSANGQGLDGAGIYIETAGGWVVKNNHIYSTDILTGNWDGYGSPQLTHGIVCLSASGTRIGFNQVADFGYHRTDTGDQYGYWVRGNTNRAFHFNCNNAWTDEDGAAVHTYYAFRFNTPGGTDIEINASDCIGKSRAGSPTMKGLKLDGGSGGTLKGSLDKFDFPDMPIGDQLTTSGGALTHYRAGFSMSNNSFKNTKALNAISHTTGGITFDARLGNTVEATLSADATSITITNLEEGETLEAYSTPVDTTTRNLDFTGFITSLTHTNPGNVAIADSEVYRAVFTNILGTVYLIDSGMIA